MFANKTEVEEKLEAPVVKSPLTQGLLKYENHLFPTYTKLMFPTVYDKSL